MGDAQGVEAAQCVAGEVSKFGVVAFCFEFCDDDDGEDHVVFGEAFHGARVGEEHRGVENVCALRGGGLVGLVRHTLLVSRITPVTVSVRRPATPFTHGAPGLRKFICLSPV